MMGWMGLRKVLGTALLLSFECAALAQLCLAIAYSQDWHEFVARNETSSTTRGLMVGLTVALAASGFVTTLVVAFLRPQWLGNWRRGSLLALPLLALWPVPPLLYPAVFADQAFVVLFVTLGVGLGLERALRQGLPQAGPLLGLLYRRWRGFDVAIVLLACAFATWAVWGSIRLHHKILSSNFDLGLFENLMWNTLHGHHGYALDRPYLGEHMELMLYVVLPFYWLFPRPETLLVIQGIIVAGAAVPLYLLARRWLGNTLPSFALACVYLAHPSVHGPLFYDFHFLSFSPFFLLWSAYFFVAKRYKLMTLSLFFTLLCREDVSLSLSLIGFSLAALRVRFRVSLIIAGVAALWFVATKLVFMQQFITDSFAQHYEHLLPDDQRGFRGMLRTLISNPVFVLSTITTPQKLLLAMHLFTPLLFLPLRQSKTLFFLLPGGIIVGLALSTTAIVEFKFHYTAHFIPYLFIAAALALALRSRLQRTSAALGMLVAALILTVQFGSFVRRPYPASFREVTFDWKEYDEQRLRDLQAIVKLIPPDAKLAASEYEGPHAARRYFLRATKIGLGRADHVLYGPEGLHSSCVRNISEVLKDRSFGVVATIGEFTLLKKGAPARGNSRALRALEKTGKLHDDGKRRM